MGTAEEVSRRDLGDGGAIGSGDLLRSIGARMLEILTKIEKNERAVEHLQEDMARYRSGQTNLLARVEKIGSQGQEHDEFLHDVLYKGHCDMQENISSLKRSSHDERTQLEQLRSLVVEIERQLADRDTAQSDAFTRLEGLAKHVSHLERGVGRRITDSIVNARKEYSRVINDVVRQTGSRFSRLEKDVAVLNATQIEHTQQSATTIKVVQGQATKITLSVSQLSDISSRLQALETESFNTTERPRTLDIRPLEQPDGEGGIDNPPSPPDRSEAVRAELIARQNLQDDAIAGMWTVIDALRSVLLASTDQPVSATQTIVDSSYHTREGRAMTPGRIDVLASSSKIHGPGPQPDRSQVSPSVGTPIVTYPPSSPHGTHHPDTPSHIIPGGTHSTVLSRDTVSTGTQKHRDGPHVNLQQSQAGLTGPSKSVQIESPPRARAARWGNHQQEANRRDMTPRHTGTSQAAFEEERGPSVAQHPLELELSTASCITSLQEDGLSVIMQSPSAHTRRPGHVWLSSDLRIVYRNDSGNSNETPPRPESSSRTDSLYHSSSAADTRPKQASVLLATPSAVDSEIVTVRKERTDGANGRTVLSNTAPSEYSLASAMIFPLRSSRLRDPDFSTEKVSIGGIGDTRSLTDPVSSSSQTARMRKGKEKCVSPRKRAFKKHTGEIWTSLLKDPQQQYLGTASWRGLNLVKPSGVFSLQASDPNEDVTLVKGIRGAFRSFRQNKRT